MFRRVLVVAGVIPAGLLLLILLGFGGYAHPLTAMLSSGGIVGAIGMIQYFSMKGEISKSSARRILVLLVTGLAAVVAAIAWLLSEVRRTGQGVPYMLFPPLLVALVSGCIAILDVLRGKLMVAKAASNKNQADA